MRNDRVVGWRPPRKGRRRALAAVAVLLCLLGIAALRALFYGAAAPEPVPGVRERVDPGAVERFAGALRFGTVSHEDAAAFPAAAFDSLHAYLAAAFPLVHATLTPERIAGHSALYSWRGSDPALAPLMLLAHLDVVPVESGTSWTRPPFAGAVAEGHVWGRGALDDKVGVAGILEAVESLVAEGFVPRRGVLLAFGHDEEVGGRGARAIAAELERRGVRPWLVLDEGGALVEDVIEGLPGTAMIGVAEKGYVSIELSAEAAGGHSSAPPRETAAGLVAAAAARVQAAAMPARIDGVTREFFHRVGRTLPFPQRLALANQWLTRPLIARALGGAPTTNALVRTTTAVTMLEAGTKDNVLPQRARAVVNFRLLPGDDADAVLAHVRGVLGDARVVATVVGTASAASPVSPAEGEAWDALSRAVRETWPDALVAPFLTIGATDARHYTALSAHVYRFLPVLLTPRELERIHGSDERIRIEAYQNAVRFYLRLLRGAAG